MERLISLIKRNRIAAFYILSVFALSCTYLFFWLNLTRYLVPTFAFVILGECGLLMSPVLILRGRWRIATAVLFWLVAVFFFANIVYARFTHDMLPLALVFDGQSYNSLVFECVPGLLRIHDIFYILAPATVTAAYRWLRISDAPAPKPSHIIAAIGTAALLYGGGLAIDSRLRTIKTPLDDNGQPTFGLFKGVACQYFEYFEGKGLVLYIYNYIDKTSARHITLSDADRAKIGNFLSQREETPIAYDSIFAANRDKNLLFIVVESLNAWPTGKHRRSHDITPVIDSLANLPGTISCFTVVPQVSFGTSSDGQLMYNTGMLPYRPIPTVMAYSTNSYQSLATTLRIPSDEYIIEDPSIWNHHNTNRQYAFSALHWGYWGDGIDGADNVLFNALADSLETRTEPFFAFASTIDMHFPYTSQHRQRFAHIDSLGEEKMATDYLNALHLFDRNLGRILKRLDSNGILDNTVVIIASDHDSNTRADRADYIGGYRPIVFMALNTGVHAEIDRPVGQIDVFPTVLQIMGRSDSTWKGLGMSMLDERNRSSVDARGNLFGTSGDSIDNRKKQAWDISELMMQGDWFGSTRD